MKIKFFVILNPCPIKMIEKFIHYEILTYKFYYKIITKTGVWTNGAAHSFYLGLCCCIYPCSDLCFYNEKLL